MGVHLDQSGSGNKENENKMSLNEKNEKNVKIFTGGRVRTHGTPSIRCPKCKGYIAMERSVEGGRV